MNTLTRFAAIIIASSSLVCCGVAPDEGLSQECNALMVPVSQEMSALPYVPVTAAYLCRTPVSQPDCKFTTVLQADPCVPSDSTRMSITWGGLFNLTVEPPAQLIQTSHGTVSSTNPNRVIGLPEQAPITISTTHWVTELLLDGQTVTITRHDARTAAPAVGWRDLELSDALSGEPFAIGDSSGRFTVVELLGSECPACASQSVEIAKLFEASGGDVRWIAIDLQSKDTMRLEQHAAQFGAAISAAALGTPTFASSLGSELGNQLLMPQTPRLILLCPSGTSQPSTTLKLVEELTRLKEGCSR